MTSLYAFEYAYDGAGNRTRKSRDGDHIYYEYDETNRLTESHDTSDDTWTYYTYDARGNTTEIIELTGTTYFEYNDRDLVDSIHYGSSGVWNYFHYDGQLRRYALQDSSGLRYFTWDTNGMNLLCERDAGGSVVRKYTHGPTPVDGIGSVIEMEDTGTSTFKYPHMDHRGSVFETTNAAESTQDTYSYNAWGEVLGESESGFSNRFQYQSNWLALTDSAASICLSPLRLYRTSTGRFAQVDRWEYTVSAPRYCYSGSAPAIYVDPYGRKANILEDPLPAGPLRPPELGDFLPDPRDIIKKLPECIVKMLVYAAWAAAFEGARRVDICRQVLAPCCSDNPEAITSLKILPGVPEVTKFPCSGEVAGYQLIDVNDPGWIEFVDCMAGLIPGADKLIKEKKLVEVRGVGSIVWRCDMHEEHVNYWGILKVQAFVRDNNNRIRRVQRIKRIFYDACTAQNSFCKCCLNCT